VVGAAGTITTGAIDPLEELAAFCGEEGLWLHVDGAYGAFAVLSSRLRDRLLPAGRADSLTLDPHKLLFMSLEAGCVLFRDRAAWRSVFSFPPTYLSLPEQPDLLHYAEYGPQLSRSWKALKIWWSLRAFGLKAYRSAIERVLDLASYMGELIESHPSLELMAPVELTAVCFRPRGLGDIQQGWVLSTLVREGLAFLGPARVNGESCMRACFVNLRTSRDDVELIVEEIANLARRASEPHR
jgi:aromatic-L-amino-acid decarboxylase